MQHTEGLNEYQNLMVLNSIFLLFLNSQSSEELKESVLQRREYWSAM